MEVLQSSDHLHGPPVDPPQQLWVFLVLGSPELDAVHESRAEGQNQLPLPAGHTSLDATLDAVGLLGCKCALLAHVESFIKEFHQQILLLRAALKPFSTRYVSVLGTALTQVQYLAIGLVELNEVGMGPPFKPFQVSLES